MNAPTDIVLETHVRAAIAQLIEEDRHGEGVECREETRYPFFQPVTITSENTSGHRSGVSRQICRSGIGLLHNVPLDAVNVTVTMRDRSGYAISLPLGQVWCRSCGAGWYISGGRFRDLAANKVARLHHSIEVQPGHSADTPLLAEMLRSVRRTIDEMVETLTYDRAIDRRAEERYYATLPVTATQLDDKSEPIGDGFQTVTRDISRRGISLFTRRAVGGHLLALEIADRNEQNKLKAVMQVLRCRSIGDLYEIAGKFVAKVYLD